MILSKVNSYLPYPEPKWWEWTGFDDGIGGTMLFLLICLGVMGIFIMLPGRDRRALEITQADEHLDMSGYEFAAFGLRYVVNRSVLLAERIDKEWRTNRRAHYPHRYDLVARRLFLDTALEQPFAVEWSWYAGFPEDPTRLATHRVFQDRHDLIEYVQAAFPEKLEEILDTEFQFLNWEEPSEELVRKSLQDSRIKPRDDEMSPA